jgi:hypothetical protein
MPKSKCIWHQLESMFYLLFLYESSSQHDSALEYFFWFVTSGRISAILIFVRDVTVGTAWRWRWTSCQLLSLGMTQHFLTCSTIQCNND